MGVTCILGSALYTILLASTLDAVMYGILALDDTSRLYTGLDMPIPTLDIVYSFAPVSTQ